MLLLHLLLQDRLHTRKKGEKGLNNMPVNVNM